MVTSSTSSIGTLPESSQRVFQNSRGSDAYYSFYSTPGVSATCDYGYSTDGLIWTKDQNTTLGNSFPMCSIAYREDPSNNRTVVYLVGSKISDGSVGSSHNILFNIGIITDISTAISWVSGTPQTLFTVGSTQATEYPVIIIDSKGYLLVAFSFVNDEGGTNKDAQNVVVCGSSTRFPVSNPSWICSSTLKSCTVGANCPFPNSGTNEGNVRDAKYLPQLIPNVAGYDALVIRGTCEGNESIPCHGQNTTTEASNTVTWTGTSLSFGSTPTTFALENASQEPADQRSATILTLSGRVFLAYANGTSGPIGGLQTIWRSIDPPYTSWGTSVGAFTGTFSKTVHLTSDGKTQTAYLFYTNCCTSSSTWIGADPITGGSAVPFYANTTASFWGSTPMIINNATNTKNLLFSIPVLWVNQAATPELWFGQFATRISPHLTEENLGEASIAVNPTDSSNMIYAGTYSNPRTPFLYSNDAGVTWANSTYPLCSGAVCGYYDEQAQFDTNGNAFVFPHFKIISGTTFGEFALKSTDKGRSFSDLTTPVWTNTTAVRFPDGTMETVCSGGSAGPFDYPRLAIDRSASSSFKNSIYVTTNSKLPIPGTTGHCDLTLQHDCIGSCFTYAVFSRSTDGGMSWTAPQVIGDGGGAVSDNIGIAVNGTLFKVSNSGAFYFPPGLFGGCNNGSDGVNGITLQKSTNGGSSFSWSCAYDNTSILKGPFFHYDAVTSPTDPTKLWISFQGFPAGVTTPHVFMISSTDAGTTWSNPVRIDDGPTNLPFSIQIVPSLQPVMSISATGRLIAEWYDFRNAPDSAHPDVYFSYSDSGIAWTPNVRLTPHTAYYCPSTSGCGPGNDFESIAWIGTVAYLTYSTDLNNDSRLDGYVTTVQF